MTDAERLVVATCSESDALLALEAECASLVREREQYRRSYETAKSLLETSEQREAALRARCELLAAEQADHALLVRRWTRK